MPSNEYPNIPHINNGFGYKIGSAISNVAGTAAKYTAKGAWWLGKQGVRAGFATSAAIGIGAIKLAQGIGSFGINTATFLGKSTVLSLHENDWRNPIGKTAKGLYNLGASLIDYTPGHQVYDEARKQLTYKAPRMRLTGKGKVALALTGLAMIGSDVSTNRVRESLGTMDTKVHTATPDYQPREYSVDFGGATGDLVFALHNNRHG